jgi:segregation and condensation protein B
MELKFILEALLFYSQKPQNTGELRQLLAAAATGSVDEQVKAYKKTPIADIEAALQQLEAEHNAAQRSYRLACVAGSWQFVNAPEYAPWLRALLGEKSRPPRLSQPGLETLTIIAYRQPLTRSEIEQIRGVSVDGVMQTLIERGLVESVGRAEVVGRPVLYGTTSAFLEYFGLRCLEDLPAAEELRRIPVTKPEALLTVDAGLATAPPEALTPGSAETNSGGAEPALAPAVAAPAEPMPTETAPTGIDTADPSDTADMPLSGTGESAEKPADKSDETQSP